MMPAATIDETVFGDMNGPLAYWGPVTASPAALLSPAEKDLLRQLRARLAAASTDLTDALTTLLTAPVGTAAA
jgi:hypothetical protein